MLVAQHRAFELAPRDAALHDDLAVDTAPPVQAPPSVPRNLAPSKFPPTIPDWPASRKPETAARRTWLRRSGAPTADVRYSTTGRSAFPADALHHLLVHRNRRRQHARAHVGQDRPVPAGPARYRLRRKCRAERETRRRYPDCAPGSGRIGRGLHLPFFRNEVLQHLVLLGVHAPRMMDFGRTQRNLVLAAAAAVDHGHSSLHL